MKIVYSSQNTSFLFVRTYFQLFLIHKMSTMSQLCTIMFHTISIFSMSVILLEIYHEGSVFVVFKVKLKYYSVEFQVKIIEQPLLWGKFKKVINFTLMDHLSRIMGKLEILEIYFDYYLMYSFRFSILNYY